jgi:hypothetical protein
MEALGLIAIGVIMLICAPFGHFHPEWKSAWHLAGWGLLCLLAGVAGLLMELLL